MQPHGASTMDERHTGEQGAHNQVVSATNAEQSHEKGSETSKLKSMEQKAASVSTEPKNTVSGSVLAPVNEEEDVACDAAPAGEQSSSAPIESKEENAAMDVAEDKVDDGAACEDSEQQTSSTATTQQQQQHQQQRVRSSASYSDQGADSSGSAASTTARGDKRQHRGGKGQRARGRSAPPRLVIPGTQSAPLSVYNIYLRGLAPDTTDEDLIKLCQRFGNVQSAKAVLEPESRKCKGYGFAMFEDAPSAAVAVSVLTSEGKNVSFARLSNTDRTAGVAQEDPTNLYFSNLPLSLTDEQFHALLEPFGKVVSSRILTDGDSGESRGVALARMEKRDHCLAVINEFDGKKMEGSPEAVTCKFADAPLHRRVRQQMSHHNQAAPSSVGHMAAHASGPTIPGPSTAQSVIYSGQPTHAAGMVAPSSPVVSQQMAMMPQAWYTQAAVPGMSTTAGMPASFMAPHQVVGSVPISPVSPHYGPFFAGPAYAAMPTTQMGYAAAMPGMQFSGQPTGFFQTWYQ